MQVPVRRPRICKSHLFTAAAAATMWFIPLSTAQAASCTEHVLEAEQELSIPRGLLLSIALVESGQDGSPQPFAMNLDGKAVYSDSASEAANLPACERIAHPPPQWTGGGPRPCGSATLGSEPRPAPCARW